MIVASLLLAGALLGQDSVPSRPLIPATVEAWLDGFMARALESGDIAGAVVVVVKDTGVVLSKGYGYADMASRTPVDPAGTLFRPGSVSKLFTWTAVMQLVERGQLDLDADIATWLDFPLRRSFDEPVTLRQILTHTAGFEETLKEFYTLDPDRSQSLRDYLSSHRPLQIYRPGSTPAYSNYATAVAGYIVERVSKLPFEDYVEQHVFEPLGMSRSTMRQPPPPDLAASVSKGYQGSSGPEWPFEIFGPGPAGGLSATGADMGRFMIAHLNGGALGDRRILEPATVALMHTKASTRFPEMNRMTLGFYEVDRNGRRIIAHGGDTQPFHTSLQLLLDEKVGFFVSFNSAGRDGAVFDTRTALVLGFIDRFFPDTTRPATPPTAATAAEHARMAEGRYEVSRRWESSFLRVLNLDQTVVAVGDSGTLTVSSIVGLNGKPEVWREVADWRWVDEGGQRTLAMTAENGRVTRIMASDDPATELLRAPSWRRATIVVPLMVTSIVVLALTILLWPVGAILRRCYGASDPRTPTERRHSVVARTIASIQLAHLIGWGMIVGLLLSSRVDSFVPELDWRLRILSLLGLLGTVGAGWLGWHAIRTWLRRDRRLPVRLGITAAAAASIVVAWFGWAFRLISASVEY